MILTYLYILYIEVLYNTNITYNSHHCLIGRIYSIRLLCDTFLYYYIFYV